MKIKFPKLIRSFSLSEYAPEMQEQIFVWVNPSGTFLLALMDKLREYIEQGKSETPKKQGKKNKPPKNGNEKLRLYLEGLSELLSQGAPETHWSASELELMITETAETDPQFWVWFNDRILTEIKEHRNTQKKI